MRWGFLVGLGVIGNPATAALLATLMSAQVPQSIQFSSPLAIAAVGALSTVALLGFVACAITLAIQPGGPTGTGLSWKPRIHLGAVVAIWASTWLFSKRIWNLRVEQARACSNGADAVVAAIDRYRQVEGEPPANLQALVPKYLKSEPRTGMLAYPFYSYSVGLKAHDTARVPYELSVEMPFGLSRDRLVYWPEWSHGRGKVSGRVVPLGEWAYIFD